MTGVHPDHSSRKTAALVSVGVGVAMLIGKWAAYSLTNSHAILSDALESIVHVMATVFAFICIVLSARPPDTKYPYGYGKIAYFSAGFEGGLIALASLAILWEGVRALIWPEPIGHLDVGLALITVASVVNLALGLWLLKKGRASESLILEADGHHVLADAYTSFGVVLGVGLVWITDVRWLDPVIAILVGLNILRTGYQLVHEAVTGLMDRADPQLLARIVEALQAGRRDGWIDVHQLRAWRAGDRTFVDFHLMVPDHWSVGRLHEAIHHAQDLLRERLGEATEVVIHFDSNDAGDRESAQPVPFSVDQATRVHNHHADVSDVAMQRSDV
jgi:cation diffusion facilitator family transporter